MADFDVAIIGAGPAGTASAITLARAGLRVAMIEKNPHPQGKVCGEGILPPGLASLTDLGIARYLNYDNSFSIRGLRYFNNHAQSAACFREGPGLGVNRLALSVAIWGALKEYANIYFLPNTEFISFDCELGQLKLSNHQTITTKFLIGADGLRSKVRRSLGLDTKKSATKRWALQAHFRQKPWADFVEVYLHRQNEAYLTPVSPEEINLVFLWSRPLKMAPKGSLKLFSHFMSNFPELSAKLKTSYLIGQPRAIGPFFNMPDIIYLANKMALVGDAAGYIDPLTGEGINLGLFSGIALAKIIAHRLNHQQAITQQDLANYQEQLRHHARAHVFLTKNLLHLIKYPYLTKQAFKILERWPSLLAMLASFNMGSYQKPCPNS